MGAWLGELKPYEGEPRASAGWRLAKSGWRLARGERAIVSLASCLAALWTLALLGPHLVGLQLAYSMPKGAVLGLFVLLASNLLIGGIAAAADAALDGLPVDLRGALAESMARRRPLAWWTLAWFAAWLAAMMLLKGFAHPMLPVLLQLGWYVVSLFVIPIVMLEGAAPTGAVTDSLLLVFRRWREVLLPLFGIGFFAILAVVPGIELINHAVAMEKEGAGAQRALFTAGFLLFALAWAFALATREAFAVLLFRYSYDVLPGNEFSGRRLHWFTKLRRVCGAVVLAFALFAAAGFAGKHDRQVLAASRAPGSNYEIHLTGYEASELPSCSPVEYEGRRIGTVLGTRDEEAGVSVHFHVDPGYGPDATPGRFLIRGIGGTARLVLEPSSAPLPQEVEEL